MCMVPEEGASRMHIRNIIVVHECVSVCMCRDRLEKNVSGDIAKQDTPKWDKWGSPS